VDGRSQGRRAAQARRQPYTPTDLREIQDWIIKPQLRNVPGVTEINTIGGYAKEFQVAPLPERSGARPDLADLVTALERNNANVGAGYIEKRGEQYLIRAPGQVAEWRTSATSSSAAAQGVPIRIRDVAEVGLGKELRTGAATENGREVVLGTVFMLIGENSRTVSQAVASVWRRSTAPCPPGWSPGRSMTAPSGGQGHCHGQEEPARRRPAGHRDPVPVPRQHPRRDHHRLVIPLAMLFTFTAW
jgi:Cu/Ag efflux pump CusA